MVDIALWYVVSIAILTLCHRDCFNYGEDVNIILSDICKIIGAYVFVKNGTIVFVDDIAVQIVLLEDHAVFDVLVQVCLF